MRQKSRELCMKDGNKNTKFFTIWLMLNVEENRIRRIRINGEWIMEEAKILEKV